MKSIPSTEELIADLERCIAAMRAYVARIDKECIAWNDRFPEHRFTRDNYPPNGSPESGAARRASLDATRALARWRQR
jgi:hypothetical protein